MYDDSERQRRVRDGAALLRRVLSNPEMHPNLLRRVLLEVFRFVSETEGRYYTRYQSEGAVLLRERDREAWARQRRHEHVFT